MDNIQMQNMISLYNQNMHQMQQQPMSGNISSSATDSQAQSHINVKAKPFYKPQTQNFVGTSQTQPTMNMSQNVPNPQSFISQQSKNTDPLSKPNITTQKNIQKKGWNDDIIDQTQHWNQIFLQDQTTRSQAKNRNSLNQEELKQK